MTTRIFNTEFLKDELDLPYECIETVFIEEHRWYDLRLCVFHHEGIDYGVEYCDPKTEMQEDMDPFDDQVTVEAYEVHQVEITTLEWQAK